MPSERQTILVSSSAMTDTTTPDLRLDGLRVLIVDDEDAIVELASLVVSEAGGEAFGAPDADAAERILQAEHIDVVVSDLVMPGTTGREFLDRLFATWPGIPVVAMSGVPEQGSHAARRANVRATLDKPFTTERLLAAVRLAATPTSEGTEPS